MRGRTISIYLPDGNARSIKVCDIQDSIVKAISIPRPKLKDVYQRPELKDPGVYFLIGEYDEVGKPEVYIGEAEELLFRLKQHNLNKDFWKLAICLLERLRKEMTLNIQI